MDSMQSGIFSMDLRRAQLMSPADLQAVLRGQRSDVNATAAMIVLKEKMAGMNQQALQAGQQPQPTVRDQVAAEAAPMSGVAQLPAGDMKFADGGIVGVDEEPGFIDRLPPDALLRIIRDRYRSGQPLLDVQPGALLPPPGTPIEVPKPAAGGTQNARDVMLARATPSSPSAPPEGIARLKPAGRTGGGPGPAKTTTPAYTPEKGETWDEFQEKIRKLAEQNAKGDKDYIDSERAVLDRQKAEIEGRDKDSLKYALIKAGLGIAAGRSSNALTNIAAGAGQGVDSYLADKKDKEKALDKFAEGERLFARYKMELQKGNMKEAQQAYSAYQQHMDRIESRNFNAAQLAEASRHNKATEALYNQRFVQGVGALNPANQAKVMQKAQAQAKGEMDKWLQSNPLEAMKMSEADKNARILSRAQALYMQAVQAGTDTGDVTQSLGAPASAGKVLDYSTIR